MGRCKEDNCLVCTVILDSAVVSHIKPTFWVFVRVSCASEIRNSGKDPKTRLDGKDKGTAGSANALVGTVFMGRGTGMVWYVMGMVQVWVHVQVWYKYGYGMGTGIGTGMGMGYRYGCGYGYGYGVV